jgi:hypothetical protein
MEQQDLKQRLEDFANPTGGKHTPTPWESFQDNHITRGEYPVAVFTNKEDRDLALYFVNVHAGMIAVLRNAASSFAFLARSTEDPGTKSFATERAEETLAYAAGFATMGGAFHADHPPSAYPIGVKPPNEATAKSVLESYKIMDIAPPGALSDTMRHYMAGAICAAITFAYTRGEEGKPLEFLRHEG